MTEPEVTPEGKFAGFELIRVTNKNDFPITDMYDGVPYLFAPNKPISIPVAAASHFFAWPTDDPKLFGLWLSKRLGWNTKADLELQSDGRPARVLGASSSGDDDRCLPPAQDAARGVAAAS